MPLISTKDLTAEQKVEITALLKKVGEIAGKDIVVDLPADGGATCPDCGGKHGEEKALAKLVELTVGDALDAINQLRDHIAGEVEGLTSMQIEKIVARHNSVEHGHFVVAITATDASYLYDISQRLVHEQRDLAEAKGVKLAISKPFKAERPN